jgi:allantoinase
VKYDLIIKNGFVIKENTVEKEDIGILDGKIIKISFNLSKEYDNAKSIMDADGFHVFPGLIDSHVHFNEPGRTEWEGIETGSNSLAAGGVTTFFDMPLNSHPPTTTKEAFLTKHKIAKKKSLIDFRLWGGVVPGNLQELENLKNCGVIGFKAFMSRSGIDDFQASDDETLFLSMKKIAELNSILAVHAESDIITEQLGKQNNQLKDYSAKAFSNARPIYSEIEAVQRILAYAEATKCKVHIVHISSSKVLEPILAARKKGIDVTVETCPHYLSLTIDDLEQVGAVAKCAPPLRSKEERDNLWNSLLNGNIDIIGSDHSPSLTSMKKGNLLEAWGGISGCQTSLSILLEEGYWKRNVSLSMIAKITSLNPAKRFGLHPNKGAITVGSDADLSLINLEESYTLKKEDLYYRNKQSPYIGKTYRGKVKRTIYQGKVVYDDKV